jgi:hypothetical protein
VNNVYLNNGNDHTNSRSVGRDIEAPFAMRGFLQIPTVHENGAYHRGQDVHFRLRRQTE